MTEFQSSEISNECTNFIFNESESEGEFDRRQESKSKHKDWQRYVFARPKMYFPGMFPENDTMVRAPEFKPKFQEHHWFPVERTDMNNEVRSASFIASYLSDDNCVTSEVNEDELLDIKNRLEIPSLEPSIESSCRDRYEQEIASLFERSMEQKIYQSSNFYQHRKPVISSATPMKDPHDLSSLYELLKPK